MLDDAEDTAPVFDFFRGDQKAIFEKTLKYIGIFENSKTYVSDQEILIVVEQMSDIAGSRNPFNQIQKLPALNNTFTDLYGSLLEKEAQSIQPVVADDYKIVMDTLETKFFANVFRNKFIGKFEELKEKLDTSNEIAGVKNIKLESDTLKLRCFDEIDEYERMHQPAPPESSVVPTDSRESNKLVTPVVASSSSPKQKKRKNVSISSVTGARTYSLENEQDIDNFLAEMKQKLMNELNQDTIITLS